MAKLQHVEWIKDGHVAWNDRRRLVKFTPDLAELNFRDAIPQWYDAGPRSDFFCRFNFSGANLRGANLAGLDFSRTKFVGADLAGADLSNAAFHRTKFNKADLSGVNARGADFNYADFAGAKLQEAELEGANFAGAQVERLTISQAQRRMVFDSAESLDDAHGLAALAEITAAKASPHTPTLPKEPMYQVLFATNRRLTKLANNISFGPERDTVLRFGSCQVFVPKSHKIGSLGSPFWRRLLRGDDRLKIRKLVILDGELHWQMVRENFATSEMGASPPTILIHGYNNTFERSVLWAAQIGFDLGLERGVSLFSWASKGDMKKYAADEATVEASKYLLVEYLLAYLQNAEGIGVNLIAHSMGCRCLTGALEIIGHKHPEKLSGINQIIMAAADVDQEVMKNAGSHIVLNSGRTTSYVCGGDVALSASGWLHEFARVGLLPPIFLFDHIDTVEVNKTDLLGLGHGYVADAKPILADMFQIIEHSAAPEQRFAIKPSEQGTSGHWRLVD